MSQQRQRYHSIPLRTQAHLMRKAGQINAETTRSTPDEACWPTMPTEAPGRLVPRHRMPLVTDAESQLPSRTSAIRYTDPQGREVIQQGKNRLVMQRTPKRQWRVSHVLFVGIGMLAMLFFWLAFQAIGTSLQAHSLDTQYSYPRFWQTDQILGLNHDSPAQKIHLMFQNLDGHIIFIVLPAGDATKAMIYSVAHLYGSDAGSWPVTATFEDVNQDGKTDVIVTIDGQQIVYLNTGTSLKPQVQQ